MELYYGIHYRIILKLKIHLVILNELNIWEGPQCPCTYCNMCVKANMKQFAFYLLNMYSSQIVPLYFI